MPLNEITVVFTRTVQHYRIYHIKSTGLHTRLHASARKLIMLQGVDHHQAYHKIVDHALLCTAVRSMLSSPRITWPVRIALLRRIVGWQQSLYLRASFETPRSIAVPPVVTNPQNTKYPGGMCTSFSHRCNRYTSRIPSTIRRIHLCTVRYASKLQWY